MPFTALIFLVLADLNGASLFFDSDINIQSKHMVAKLTFKSSRGIHSFTKTFLKVLLNDLLELMRNIVSAQG